MADQPRQPGDPAGWADVDAGAPSPPSWAEPRPPELEGRGDPGDAGAPPGSAPPAGPRASRALLVTVAGVSLFADGASKAWAKAALTSLDGHGVRRRIEVIPGCLDFVFAQNPGGAWSMLRGMPEVLRRPFFLFVSAAAIVFIIHVYTHLRASQTAMKWGLPLALGGALGNLVDRIRYGYVIDFIDAYVVAGGRERHWPTFNVADIAIVAGVLLMAFESLLPRKGRKAGGPVETPHDGGPPERLETAGPGQPDVPPVLVPPTPPP